MTLRRLLSLDSWILAGLLLVALLTRFYQLGTWSLWPDELYTIEGAATIGDALGSKPVQYLLTRGSLEIFGTSEWSARLPSAIAGALAPPLLYLALRPILPTPAAVLASALVVFSPWHLFHSQAARFYATLFLFSSLAAFGFYRGLTRGSAAWLLGSAFLTLLAALTHTSGIFLIPSFVLWGAFVAWGRRDLPISRPFVVVLVASGVALALLLGPTAVRVAGTWIRFGASWGYSLPHLILGFVYNLGLPLAVVALCALGALLVARDPLGPFLLAYVGVPLLAMAALGQVVDARPDYLFYSVPAYFALAGIGLARIYDAVRLRSKILATGAVALVFIAQAPSIASYYSDGNRHPERAAAEFIQRRMRPQDVVMSRSPGLFEHYTGVAAVQVNTADLASYGANGRRLWILATYNRNGMAGLRPEVIGWIYGNCRLASELIPTRYDYHDNSLRVFLCGPS